MRTCHYANFLIFLNRLAYFGLFGHILALPSFLCFELR
jgi:hypothetical protein